METTDRCPWFPLPPTTILPGSDCLFQMEWAGWEDVWGYSTVHCTMPAGLVFTSPRNTFLISDGPMVAAGHPLSHTCPKNSKAKPNLLQKTKPDSVWLSLSPWVNSRRLGCRCSRTTCSGRKLTGLQQRSPHSRRIRTDLETPPLHPLPQGQGSFPGHTCGFP